MGRYIAKYINERNLFYFALMLNATIMLSVRFIPTMDGPCHLYNSNILSHLLNGNPSILHDYFVLNRSIVPNWISYCILTVFNYFLPAWIAEKILILLYLFGISISFRLLIKELIHEEPGLSIFIIPFVHSFLFYLGFYNYSYSFIFLYFTLYYWLKTYDKNNSAKYLVLLFLLLLTYFSAIITYFFLGFSLGLITVAISLKQYHEGKDLFMVIKTNLRKLGLLLLASIPSLVLSAVFIISFKLHGGNEHYSAGELTKWLNDVRCLIIYDYIGEENLTEQFLHLMIAILAISLYIRFFRNGSSNKQKVQFSDLFLVPIIISLVLLFVTPNNSGAGMMSDRYCLLFYMFFIIWISSQRIPQKLNLIVVFLVIILQTGLLFKHYNGSVRSLNRDAVTLFEASSYIKENSTVLPVNLSEHWLEPHFSNYLGVDKPMIILEVYAASVDWFPVKWNYAGMPALKLSDNTKPENNLSWPSNPTAKQVKLIDYVCLYGNLEKLHETKWSDLDSILNTEFHLEYLSDNHYVSVYKRIKQSE